VRLLVVHHGETLLSERLMLRLGADIEAHGHIPDAKLAEVAAAVKQFVADAEAVDVAAVDVLIASPGRQAENGEELRRVLAEASGRPTRVLTSTEEAHLAFAGALSVTHVPARRMIAVVDVGGGSAQVVVGTGHDGPQWSRSIDIGSQRLTSRMLSEDPPGPAAIGAARAEVERYLAGWDAPPVRTTLAVGGSARALKRIVGPRIGVEELDHLLELFAETPTSELAKRYGIGEDRVRTLAAGAVIISGLQHHLGTPLKVVRAGLRDGALLTLAAEQAAAAA
jgi:exopolyphosphatase/guanosine-5'-triphosphate,3'-diphosphate pyrophosphatase